MSILDHLRTANRNRIARRRLTTPAIDTPLGFKFSGIRQMMGHDWEADERVFLQHLLPQFDLFVNVGAHYGFYACIAQQLGITTVALEPIPANCGMIAKHMQANGWGANVTLLPVAAGTSTGFIEIQGGGSGGTVVKGFSMAPASQVQTVPVVRLEDVIALRQRRALFLMDVEGFELAALQGAKELLVSSPKPVLMVEVLPFFGTDSALRPNPNFIETFRFMDGLGYRAWRIASSLTPFNLDQAQITASQATGIDLSNYLFMDKSLGLDDLGLAQT